MSLPRRHAALHGTLRLLLAALAIATSAAASAGQTCAATPPDTASVTHALALADSVRRSLDASGAQVVLLARAGQDLSKYGLRYSHLGFAYREPAPADPSQANEGRQPPPAATAVQEAPTSPPTPAPRTPGPGTWRIAHKLNACGTADAAIYRQGLAEFFLDTPYRYEAAYVVLQPAAQATLLPLLRDDRRLVQWHTPAYSMVAYPWATTYQQSNQWAIETLAGALDPAASTRARAQAWLQLHDYRPTVLHLDAFTRLGARMTKDNVAFDDHPNAKRFSDHIETVSVDSVFDWLQRVELASAPVEIR